jgi:hypothetical protein
MTKLKGVLRKKLKWYHVKHEIRVNLKKLGDDLTNDQKVEFSHLHDKFEKNVSSARHLLI